MYMHISKDTRIYKAHSHTLVMHLMTIQDKYTQFFLIFLQSFIKNYNNNKIINVKKEKCLLYCTAIHV